MRARTHARATVVHHFETQSTPVSRERWRDGEGRRDGERESIGRESEKHLAWIEGVGGYDTSVFNEAAILNNNNDAWRTRTACAIVLMEVR